MGASNLNRVSVGAGTEKIIEIGEMDEWNNEERRERKFQDGQASGLFTGVLCPVWGTRSGQPPFRMSVRNLYLESSMIKYEVKRISYISILFSALEDLFKPCCEIG
jgi:hypothetical protein